MKISCIDKKEFEKKEGYSGVDLCNNLFDVILIVIIKGEISYLVNIGEQFGPMIHRAELFNVVDNSLPSYWAYRYYGFKNKLKNREYNFDVFIDAIIGPKELVENDKFMFDIYENPRDLSEKIYRIMQKYKGN
ncbi:MAG: hypothetical protein PHD15_02335 [Clostridia bacterium]|nr:hypothetical protein [Clostridia bacterium]MDD4386585.1 hypothetical protein [Clostridia bacterium]